MFASIKTWFYWLEPMLTLVECLGTLERLLTPLRTTSLDWSQTQPPDPEPFYLLASSKISDESPTPIAVTVASRPHHVNKTTSEFRPTHPANWLIFHSYQHVIEHAPARSFNDRRTTETIETLCQMESNTSASGHTPQEGKTPQEENTFNYNQYWLEPNGLGEAQLTYLPPWLQNLELIQDLVDLEPHDQQFPCWTWRR